MVASRPIAFQNKQDNWLTNHEVIEAPWASCGSSLLPSLQAQGAAYPWCTCQVARSRSFFPMPTATLAVNTYPLPFQSEGKNVSNNQWSKHLKSSHSTPMRPETSWIFTYDQTSRTFQNTTKQMGLKLFCSWWRFFLSSEILSASVNESVMDSLALICFVSFPVRKKKRVNPRIQIPKLALC